MKNTSFHNAFAVVWSVFAMSYFFWISWSDKASDNRHIGEVKVFLITTMGIVVGYFYGSSQDSKKKTEAMENLIAPKDGSTTITTVSPDPAVMKAKEEIKQNEINNNQSS